MPKWHLCKAAFNVKFVFWGKRKYIFPPLCLCALFDTQLLDALEVNPVRGHPAGAKVGHCTKQNHSWNYWINASPSVYVLVKINYIRSEKYSLKITCVLQIATGILQVCDCYGACHLVSNLPDSHQFHLWYKV